MSNGFPTSDYEMKENNKNLKEEKIKVCFLGDSIRDIGYGPRMQEILGDKYDVFLGDDNCRFAPYLLRKLFDDAAILAKADIIHFNCGLWDICDLFNDGHLFTDYDVYERYIIRIVTIMKRWTNKIIFSTITPVKGTNPYNKNRDIEEYNQRIIPVLERMGVIINDIYTPLASNLDKYIADDLLHLSSEGIELAANQIATVIKKL